MWFTFILTMIAIIGLLYIPGTLFLRGLNFDKSSSILLSPLASIAEITLLCMFFGLMGIRSNFYSIMVPLLLFGLGLACVTHRKNKQEVALCQVRWQIILFVLFGLGIASYLYIRNLNTLMAFNTDNDNITHLGLIAAFTKTGMMSSFNANVYSDVLTNQKLIPIAMNGAGANLTGGISFYPAAYHTIAALAAMCSGANAVIAENAINFVFLSVIYSMSSYTFLSHLFNKDDRLLLYGAIVTYAFAAFPWRLLVWGPVYPQFASLTLMPLECCLVLIVIDQLVDFKSNVSLSAKLLCLFLLSGISLGLMQPNSIFACLVVMAPYLVIQYYNSVRSIHSFFRSSFKAFILLFVLFAIWVLLNKSSVFSVVTGFHWNIVTSNWYSQFINLISLSFNYGHAQVVLGLLTLIGFITIFKHEELRWLNYSFFIVFFICLYNGCKDNAIRNLLSGFWYNDPTRVAAIMVLVSIPLACYGFAKIVNLITVYVFDASESSSVNTAIWGLVLSIIAVVIYWPNYTFENSELVQTAFGEIDKRIETVNNPDQWTGILDADKIDFIHQVKAIVPDGALILNNPYDGSVFAYAAYGLNVYYRNMPVPDDPATTQETPESLAIRNRLNDYSTDKKVRDAVSSTGAKYVLILHYGGRYDGDFWYGYYYPGRWNGLNRINDFTPGFEVVLKQGDMRLYRIVD